ncbi:type III-B CRISPR module RAMP protein Cmr6 [Oceanithermus sp.]
MPASTRRKNLQHLKVGTSTHPGLWLDKYLWSSDRKETDAKRNLVDEVKDAVGRTKDHYKKYFERYEALLASRPGLTYTMTGETRGRLSVGLGANAVLETSITLHHTYGVPYIPGSALKGLASSYAAKHLEDQDSWKRSFKGGKTERGVLQKLIFGDTSESGLVIFYDALPKPEDFQLDADVITVHHPDYYQGGKKPPADWDSPTPVPFITARGTFRFYLGLVPLPEGELEKGRKVLELAALLLKKALEEEGVGAKTTLGYGRIKIEGDFSPLKPPPPKRSEEFEKAMLKAESLRWSNDAPRMLADIAKLWSQLPREEQEELEAFLVQNKSQALGYHGLDEARKRDEKLDALLKKLRR